MFTLDTRLAKDCIEITDFPLCKLLLMNESRYPWFILVPKVDDVSELIDLTLAQQQRLWDESNLLSHLIKTQFSPDKLNIAALGNIVPQLHLHHVARYEDDAAWPAPVWGKFVPEPYVKAELDDIKKDVLQYIAEQADL